MKKFPMFTSVPLKRWVFIYPPKFAQDSEFFLGLLKEVADGWNYEMASPKLIAVDSDSLNSYVKAIQDFMTKDPKMIMIVVPNNAADRYAAIKRLTCVNKAIPTQVIVAKTMKPKSNNIGAVKSIAAKVMVQVNCKLGGAPWMVKFPVKGLMTIGFDVTHDSRNRSQSYGAFIASMDLKEKVEYYSAASAHKDGAEMSKNIGIHLVKALRQFQEVHNALPERIMFYRDGIGDGQIEYVHSQEVKRLKQQLEEVYGKSAAPKFSVILVCKRINTRFFRKVPNRMENPVSGTVVDNTITLPER
jgi:aubergine